MLLEENFGDYHLVNNNNILPHLLFDLILVEKFLSQISVYNQIRGAIDGTIGGSLLFDITHEVEDLKIICKRSGPAFTIIVENKEKTKHCIEYEEELFHCDFTFALYCPKFPECAQGNEK